MLPAQVKRGCGKGFVVVFAALLAALAAAGCGGESYGGGSTPAGKLLAESPAEQPVAASMVSGGVGDVNVEAVEATDATPGEAACPGSGSSPGNGTAPAEADLDKARDLLGRLDVLKQVILEWERTVQGGPALESEPDDSGSALENLLVNLYSARQDAGLLPTGMEAWPETELSAGTDTTAHGVTSGRLSRVEQGASRTRGRFKKSWSSSPRSSGARLSSLEAFVDMLLSMPCMPQPLFRDLSSMDSGSD